ncbi:MAG: nucleotidyltransferase family protein [Dehalococcoidia bacterium]
MKIRPPTPIQAAALGAALLPGEGAFAAYDELRALTDNLDHMDAATFRMLPMVYRNLKALGVDDERLATLKGIYRQSWYRNRISVGSAMRAVTVLRANGVEPVALKGLGLIASAYREAALRPMHDVDLLIAPGSYRASVDALVDAGWKPLRGDRADFFRRVRVFHALPLAGPDGIEVDLHRRMLEENCFPGADEHALARTRCFEIGDDTVTTLAPEDHVINACVHGVRWDPVPALRWVLDVVVAVRSAGENFDWNYLVEEARNRRITLALAGALEFARSYESSIPEVVLEQLAAIPADKLERFDFRVQQGGNGLGTQVARYFTRYGRLASGRGVLRKVTEFPTYLECMWELDSPSAVPRDGISRIWRRLREG